MDSELWPLNCSCVDEAVDSAAAAGGVVGICSLGRGFSSEFVALFDGVARAAAKQMVNQLIAIHNTKNMLNHTCSVPQTGVTVVDDPAISVHEIGNAVGRLDTVARDCQVLRVTADLNL